MSAARFPVIDFHVHLPVANPADPGGRRGVARYLDELSDEQVARLKERSREAAEKRWQEWGFEPPESDPPSAQEQADRWAREVDEHGLKRVVLTTGGGNEQLSALVARHPDKLSGFAHHRPGTDGAPAELKHAIEDLGLAGYKVFASALPMRLDDEGLEPLWEIAEKLRIPVLVHFGVGTRNMGVAAGPSADPLCLQNVARRHQDLEFVVPHFGAGYLKELLLLCWACANVNVDCSGSNEWLAWTPMPMPHAEVLRRFYETIGPRRILFGTDSSYFPRGFIGRYLDLWLNAAEEVGMDDAEQALMFAGNAERLLSRS